MNFDILKNPAGYQPKGSYGFDTDPASALNYQPTQSTTLGGEGSGIDAVAQRQFDWSQGLSDVFKSVGVALSSVQRPQVRQAVAGGAGVSPGSFDPRMFAAYGPQAPQPLQNYAALYRRV